MNGWFLTARLVKFPRPSLLLLLLHTWSFLQCAFIPFLVSLSKPHSLHWKHCCVIGPSSGMAAFSAAGYDTSSFVYATWSSLSTCLMISFLVSIVNTWWFRLRCASIRYGTTANLQSLWTMIWKVWKCVSMPSKAAILCFLDPSLFPECLWQECQAWVQLRAPRLQDPHHPCCFGAGSIFQYVNQIMTWTERLVLMLSQLSLHF